MLRFDLLDHQFRRKLRSVKQTAIKVWRAADVGCRIGYDNHHYDDNHDNDGDDRIVVGAKERFEFSSLW
jgi:hypothetical protein